jgi:hypothetical protein
MVKNKGISTATIGSQHNQIVGVQYTIKSDNQTGVVVACLFQILPKQASLNEVLCGFPQPLQGNGSTQVGYEHY